jgi:hypothetical protein
MFRRERERQMTELAIDWYDDRYGEHSEDDTYRAEKAAREVLSAAGITDYRAAFEAYERWRAGEPGGEIAIAWMNAEIAACRAATAGWYNPHEAGVFLSA